MSRIFTICKICKNEQDLQDLQDFHDFGNRDIRKPAVACRSGAGAPEPYSCIILLILEILQILLLYSLLL